jgi:hypothetical protein
VQFLDALAPIAAKQIVSALKGGPGTGNTSPDPE